MKIMIEPTNRCNQNCEICCREKEVEGRIGDLTFENFKKIIKKLPKLERIKLQGFGEPFLNPEIDRMAKYAKKKCDLVWTTTNGTIYKKGLFKNFDAVVISVNTLKRDLNNILKIQSECKHQNKYPIPIIINYVTTKEKIKENESEIEDIKAFIYKINKIESNIGLLIKKLWIAEQEDWFSYKDFKPYNQIIKGEVCQEVTPFISWDGYVNLCCKRMNPLPLNFGNIFEQSWEEIYESDKYKEFRQIAGYCNYCRGCIICPVKQEKN